MAGRITVWGAQQLLTSYFVGTTAVPESFWLALVRTVPPTPYMDGTELDEPDSDDYARIEIPNDQEHWANDSQPQEIYNLLPAQFITATADWGPIGFWALCNAPVDGFNFLVGDLENPVLVSTGDQVEISEGDLSVSLGPFFLAEEA
jgi:hypothetical protein